MNIPMFINPASTAPYHTRMFTPAPAHPAARPPLQARKTRKKHQKWRQRHTSNRLETASKRVFTLISGNSLQPMAPFPHFAGKQTRTLGGLEG